MSRVLRALRRPVVGAIAAFLVVCVVLLGAVGAYLATHPSFGSTAAAFYARAISRGGTSGYSLNVIRAADGAWLELTSTHPGLPNPPAGILVGKAKFTVGRAERGWPRPTQIIWDLTLDGIEPAPGGPSAGDETVWRRMIAEALGHNFPGRYDLPAAIRGGAAHGVTWNPGAFILNMGERLWYSPRWSIGALAIAGVAGLVVGEFLRRHPRRAPGACRQCGYDLAGLAAGVCPECGHSALLILK